MKSLLVVFFMLMLVACNSANLKKSFLGFDNQPYVEPESESVAYLVVDAPKLKKKLMVEDTITVSFYNSCTDNSAFRNEGYIGGFELSSKKTLGKTKTVKINVDAPLFVEVGYADESVQCTNKFRLLPEADATYKIHWEYEWGKCSSAGLKALKSGEYVESDEIIQQHNNGSFWNGASGRTTSEWRGCATLR